MISAISQEKISIVHLGKKNAGPSILHQVAKSLEKSAMLGGVIHASLSGENDFRNFRSKSIRTYNSKFGFVMSILLLPIALTKILYHLKSFGTKKAMFVMPHLWDFALIPFLRIFGKFQIIYWVHDSEPHPGDLHFLTKFNQKIAIYNSNLLVTLSDFVTDMLKKQYKNRIITLTHPVRNGVKGETRKIRNPKAPKVVFVGRLVQYKGLERLQQAWLLFSEKFPEADLTLAGTGENYYVSSLFEKMRNVNLQLGYLDLNDMNLLLRNSDILALPYDEASQSGILVQGVENQIIYVATPVGALPEQNHILGGGLIAENMTARSFAEALENACNLGSVRILHNSKSHTWDAEMLKLFYALQEMASKSHV